jgi:hypothetical protein
MSLWLVSVWLDQVIIDAGLVLAIEVPRRLCNTQE